MVPQWFEFLSVVSLAVGVLSAAAMTVIVLRNPPKMAVMAFVWPLCALFAGPLVIWFHRRHGGHGDHGDGEDDRAPSLASIVKGTLHCGAGCSLADLIAETTFLLVPGLLVLLGYGSLFGEKIFAGWVGDYILALAIGIAFQYFAIAPMRGLGVAEGLREAAKADVLSLSSWQVGMYGLMAIAHFWLFAHVFGAKVEANDPAFWFAMQWAMIAGFFTALPVNRWLIARGIKEAM